MDILFQNFWALALVVICVHAFVLKYKSQRYIKNDPGLRRGYDGLVRGYLIWMSIPWIVMGIGALLGHVPLESYFQPKQANPYVLAWWGTVVVLHIFAAWWIFIGKGADILARYPEVFNVPSSNPMLVKGFFALTLAGGITAMVILFQR